MLKIYQIRFLTFVFAFCLLASSPLLAQQLPQINYQGVARKADGSIISDQSIRLRLTIRDGGANGNSVYAETRQRTTSKFGLFTVVIGSAGATAQTGAMATINWATGNKFLQVELDPLGGNSFIDMGTSQLQSVPYAIYAATAAPTGTAGGDLSGNYPNPSISKLNGAAISITAPLTGQVLKWNGSAWTPANELASTAGPQGIQGVAGVAGTKGDIGAAGAKGDIGATGAAGTNGTTGAKGDIGASGAAGTAGLTTSVNGVTQVNGAITLSKSDIGLGNVSNTADADKPVSSAIQTALDAKASLVALAAKADQSAVDLKAPLASPTFTGTVSGVTATMVGLGNVNNTSDAAKPISTAIQTALDLKASVTALAAKADQSAVDLKASLASPTFTGTVSGVTATMVGLGNVNNTTDLLKPISTATQTALDLKASVTALAAKADQSAVDLKASLASPTFTGTVSGVTATMVGLGSVNNTTDLLKPISTATQTALDLKASIAALAAKADQSAVDLKAPIASPTFTGAPILPTGTIGVTQAVGNNTTALATTAFVTAATSAGGSFVDLTNAQTIAGVKTFSSDVFVNGIRVGRGSGTILTGNTAANTAVGNGALSSNTTGRENTAVGLNTLSQNTTGVGNTANGTEALRFNTTGSYNTANGSETLISNTTGSYNTANGNGALYVNTTGNNNVAMGNNVMFPSSTGSNNTGIGTEALRFNTTGSNNVGLGYQSLYSGTTNLNNTAIGREALKNQNASRNTALGFQAGLSIVGADDNTVIGASADVTGNSANATAIGYGAVATSNNTIQLGNTAVTNTKTSGTLTAGSVTYPNAHNNTAGQVLTVNASGLATWAAAAGSGGSFVDLTTAQTIAGVKTFSNDAVINTITVGRGSGTNNASNTAVGKGALSSNTTGRENTAVGLNTLSQNTIGNFNNANGMEALRFNTTGSNNTANGYNTLFSNTTGSYNTANGHNALYGNTIGDNNVAMGYNTMFPGSTGSNNTAIGTGALRFNLSGSNNVGIGNQALWNGTTGLGNTANGAGALFTNTIGSRNTALGYQAGLSITGADNNTVIGASADVTGLSTTNATALGYGAIATASNGIQLGNSSVTNVKTNGTLTAGTVTYPNAHNSTAGQVLTVNTSGTATWATSSGGGGVPYTGATGAVDLGAYNLTVNGITVGSGSGTAANTAVGYQALLSNTSGDANTAIGNSALRSNTGGVRNTATGIDAMRNNTSGGENTASGYFSLKANNNGSKNTATGYESLNSNTSGARNTGIGVQALRSNSTGSSNTATGNTALDSNTGSQNTASGDGVLFDNTSGNNNTALGFNTGRGLSTGSGNTILGANVTGLATALTNNIILANGTGAIKAQNDGTNWTLTGGLIAGGITYPSITGTNGQVLTTNGSGVASWATASGGGGVPYTGATGAVDLGAYNLTVNGITVGRGSGAAANTAVGFQALFSNTGGDANTAIGNSALTSNTGGVRNTATGIDAMRSNTSGSYNTASGYHSLKANNGNLNTATGYESLISNSSGSGNTGIGLQALSQNGTGSDNTALGTRTAQGITTGSGNTILGANVGNTPNTALTGGLTNNIILANGTGAIKAQNDGTDWTMSGSITASGYKIPSGTSSQFLMANGSVSTGPREVADELNATASQTSFPLTQTPATNSKVKMYINGLRTSNAAYSVSGTTLTYNPVNNLGYMLVLNDKIQFDYYY